MPKEATRRERSTFSASSKVAEKNSLTFVGLPLKNRASEIARPGEQAIRSHAKTKLLIVHDGALAGFGLARVVDRERRFKICGQTHNRAIARELLTRYQPQIILLGLGAADGHAIALIKELRKFNRAAAIILVSWHEDSVSVQRAFRAGARGYLTIHDKSDDVLEAIEQVLAGHLYASTSLTDCLLQDLADGEIESVNSELRTLSDRELQVFWLIGRGFGPSRLANELHLSVKTIETHQSHIKEKLGLRSAAELSEKASRWMVQSARQNLRLRRRIASQNGKRAAAPSLRSC